MCRHHCRCTGFRTDLLRIFVFHPFSINDKMANASVKTGDLVVATRNAQVDRSDLALYKVGGKNT